MKTTKDPIRLRQRKMASGNISLYLDIYVKGKRKYEYLNIYLIPENSRADKEYNRQMYALADTIRAQRLIDLRNKRYNLNDEGVASPYLISYLQIVIERKRKELTKATVSLWETVLFHIRTYIGDDKVSLEDATTDWLQSYVDYLTEEVSANSARTYITKITAMFHEAVKDGLLMSNPMSGVDLPKKEETHREFLTIEEVRAMAAAECTNNDIKRAFLFSCLTGLRFSDIKALKWGDIRQQGQFTRLVYRQQKTNKQEYLDISPQAVQYMGERGDSESNVFALDMWVRVVCDVLREWTKAAGITKHITFHSGRHTFAVMMLDLGVDIYTVSKMLGHKDIKTTQIYAELLDKRKQEAVLRIPEI